MRDLVMWQYCSDLNDINRAIIQGDENWKGLRSAEQIISITFDTNHMQYVVVWIKSNEIRVDMDKLLGNISVPSREKSNRSITRRGMKND